MKTKIIKKLILSCDRCTTEVFVHTNTSDEWDEILLLTADSIEGEIYGKSKTKESYITTVCSRTGHNEYGNYMPDLDEFQKTQLGFGYTGDYIELDPMYSQREDPEKYTEYSDHEIKIDYGPEKPRQVILYIAPHDRVEVRSDVMEIYEIVEDDHKALYDKWALPTISYKLLGDKITLNDDRIACHIELSVSRMFQDGDDKKPDFISRFFHEFGKITVNDLYQYDVEKRGFTQEDVERVKKMIQWWQIEKNSGIINWIKPIKSS